MADTADFLNISGRPTTPGPQPSPGSIGVEEGRVRALQSMRSADQASRQRVDSFRLSQESGLPYDLIHDNFDTVAPKLEAAKFDVELIAKGSPELAKWLTLDSKHANMIGGNDVGIFGQVENFFRNIDRQFELGQMNVELADLAMQEMSGTLTPENAQRQKAIRREQRLQQEFNLNFGMDGFMTGKAPAMIAGQVPILMRSAGAAAQGALAGASAGALWGAVGGPLAPATSAAGALSGAAAGAVAGMAGAIFELEGGLAYDEFMQEPGADKDIARALAMVVGALNTVPEMVGAGTLLKAVPGGRRLLSQLSKEGIKALAKTPSGRAALAEYGKNIATAMGAEGGTEGLQELNTHVAGVINKHMQAGDLSEVSVMDVLGEMFGEEARARVGEAALGGVVVGGFFAGVGGSPSLARNIAKAKEATRTADAFLNIGDRLAQAEIAKKNPALAAMITEHIGKGTGIDRVYVPIEAIEKFAEQHNADAAVIAAELTGEVNALESARATAGDSLAVDIGKYASVIAPTKANEFFANEIRLTPDSMNANEAVEFYKKLNSEQPQSEVVAFDSVPITPDVEKFIADSIKQQDKALAQQGVSVVGRKVSAALREQSMRAFASRGVDIVANAKLFDVQFTDLSKETPGVRAQVQSLLKTKGREALGATIKSDKGIRIAVYHGVTAKTLVHELGHAFTFQLSEISNQASTPKRVKDDWNTLAQAVGLKEGQQLSDMTNQQSEALAGMFERYIAENKAPSLTLRKVLQRFKDWIARAWPALQSLPQISDEVRTVFNRALATDIEIVAAEEQQNVAQDFFDDHSWLPEEVRDEYGNAIAEASAQARQELFDQALEQEQRKAKRWWREEHQSLVDEALVDISARPEYRAIADLQAGPRKINTADLKRLGGKNILSKLPRKPKIHDESGLHPDAIAPDYGFHSGQHMIEAIAAAKDPIALANQHAERVMRERHGDMFTDGTLSDRAMAAVYNRSRISVARRTLELMVTDKFAQWKKLSSKIARKIPSQESIISNAIDRIWVTPVGQISPTQHRAAAARSARKAIDFKDKGRFSEAFDEKLRELHSIEMFRAANEALEKTAAIINRVNRYNTKASRKKIQRAGQGHTDELNALFDKYGVNESHASVDPKGERFKRLTYGQMRQLGDELLAVIRRASYESEVRDQHELDAARVIDEINAKARPLQEKQDKYRRGLYEEEGKLGKAQKFLAELDGVEFLVEALQGENYAGAVRDLIWNPIQKASENKAIALKPIVAEIKKLSQQWSRRERSRMSVEKIYIEKLDDSLTKTQLISLALNMGNQYNADAVINGSAYAGRKGWTRDGVMEALKHLDEKDVAYVNGIWKILESLWEPASAVDLRVNGTVPPRVEATPFKVGNHEFTGGYYPVKFLKEELYEEVRIDENGKISSGGGMVLSPMTNHGHRKERTQTGNRPIDLSLGIVGRHIESVVHDFTHREAVMKVSRLISDHRVAETIRNTLGTHNQKQFIPWLNSVANDVSYSANTSWENMLHEVRGGVATAMMGMKLSVMLVQPTGLFITANRVGVKNTLRGVSMFLKNPKQAIELVYGLSTEMKNRAENVDRDARDVIRKHGLDPMAGKLGAYTADFEDSLMKTIALGDLAVSIPTWLAGYQQAFSGGVEGVAKSDQEAAAAYADAAVRLTQGSGQAKDLAQIQQKGNLIKLFTMFYQYFGIHHRTLKSTLRKKTMGATPGELATTAMLIWFIPPILEGVLLGRDPDWDDEDGGKEWLKWSALELATYPGNGIIFARDFMYGFKSIVMKGYAGDFAGSPVFSLGNDIFKATEGVARAVDSDRDVTSANIKGAVRALGVLGPVKLPTSQMITTLEYLILAGRGEQPDQSIPERIGRALVAGPERD